MAKTFENIVTNVSNDIGDTSAEMQSIIGVYVNNRYRQVLRTTNFTIVNDDYTISVSSGTDSYTLPTDFGKELYAVDTTNNRNLRRTTFNLLADEFSDSLNEAGTVDQYIVFRDDSNNQKVKFFRNPSSNITVAFPYTVNIRTDLSSTDVPVNDFADLLELGAKADAWRYKRQFAKAAQFDVMFDSELDNYMWYEANQENERALFTGNQDDYNRDSLV